MNRNPTLAPNAAAGANSWTDERVELLKKLWIEGLSSSQIAKQLRGVTRNAVIGKVSRLGLLGRQTPSGPAKLPKPVREPRAQARVFGETRVKPAVVFAGPNAVMSTVPKAPFHGRAGTFQPLPGATPVPFLQRTGDTCRWPVGEDAEGMLCCGLESPEGRSYCERHAATSVQRLTPGAPRTANDLARSLRRYV